MTLSFGIPEGQFVASDFNFGPASRDEPTVHGAQCPGNTLLIATSEATARPWVEFMHGEKIRRVCCLLGESQIQHESFNLLDLYRREFGDDRVLHAPILGTCDADLFLKQVLPFFLSAEAAGEKVVVHCLAGFSRTGQVLAAWLIAARRMSADEAVEAVRASAWRDPLDDKDGRAFLQSIASACNAK